MPRKPPKTPLDWAACGTARNYAAHRRRGEEACRPCKAAHARHRKSFGHPTCRECDRQTQVKGLCAIHFRAKYGMTVHAYRRARAAGADPLA